jgi:AraC-like DNA-binding protein
MTEHPRGLSSWDHRSVASYSHVRVLLGGPHVSVTLIRCAGTNTSRSREEASDGDQITFVRAGFFVRHSAGASVAADANHVLFFRRDHPYRVEHPVSRGDECVVFSLSSADRLAWLEHGGLDIQSSHDPFPHVAGLITPSAALRMHSLVAALRRELDPLEADERALSLLASVSPPPALPGRRAPARDGRAVAEHVKLLIQRNLGDRLTLSEIAGAVGMSAFRLCRVFHASAGLPIHRYRTRLRLHTALQRLAEGERDLTRLAMDLGFADHPHFTQTFRSTFGLTYQELLVNAAPALGTPGREPARGLSARRVGPRGPRRNADR